jgi:AbrB family looped-hinge helix DNA binding protein
MHTAIDRAGRIVVPKALREALGLTPGQPLDISVRDGRIEIEPVPTPMRLVRHGTRVVAVPDVDVPPLTAAMVRETLEHVRR